MHIGIFQCEINRSCFKLYKLYGNGVEMSCALNTDSAYIPLSNTAPLLCEDSLNGMVCCHSVVYPVIISQFVYNVYMTYIIHTNDAGQ